MSKVCEICGRGPRVGFSVSHAHNRNKRRWEINLQNMKVLIDGSPKQVKVCTRCIQSGKIERPKFVLKERKPKVKTTTLAEAKAAVVEEVEEQLGGAFFSDKSIVDVIFKPKKKKAEEEVEETTTESKSDDEKSPEPEIEIVETEIISDDGIDIYGDQ